MSTSSRNTMREYVLDSLERYWPSQKALIRRVCGEQASPCIKESLPPELIEIRLPDWARDVSVDGHLLVPRHQFHEEGTPDWKKTDWLGAASWHLNGAAERQFEEKYGAIHSYASRLRNWDSSMWDRAWVNRIALFLRRWAAHDQQADEQALFGDLPKASIHLSHDVDAVSKTPAIRLKQTAFHLLNAAKDIASGRAPSLGKALRFLTGKGSYDCFSTIAELEKQHGFTSQFNVYAGKTGWCRSPKQRLMDPSYSVDEQWLQEKLRSLVSAGHRIGLHQSFDSWTDPEAMRRERERLEEAINTPVVGCRQHWLRFSWQTTWRAQEESGLQLDGTLGFNDRPGFRNGAALSFHPWDEQAGKPLSLKAIPLLFMDSHFYDYTNMCAEERQTQMKRWVDEVLDVQGEATIIWHQRVFSPDYGWGSGYRELLSLLARC